MENSYLPVQWVYREVAAEQIARGASGKIFYFSDGQVCEISDTVLSLKDEPEGVFLYLQGGASIRLDRVITLFGKPGAAYDEYDAFANACMDCNGGYSQEEINEFNSNLRH